MNLAGRLAALEGYRRKIGTGPCRECGSRPPKFNEQEKLDRGLAHLAAAIADYRNEAGENWFAARLVETTDPHKCPRCKRPDPRIDHIKEYARELEANLQAQRDAQAKERA